MAYIINLILVLMGIILTKKGMDREYVQGDYPSDLYLSPEEINYFMTSTNHIERAIVGTLLNLYSKGNIEINHYQRDSRNKNLAEKVDEFLFSLKSTENLTDIEKKFIQLTFNGKEEITTDQINQRNKDQGKDFFDSWGEWTLQIEKSLKEKGLFSTKRTDQERNYFKTGIAMMIVSAFLLFISENPLYILGLFASFPVILVHMEKSMRKTPMGNGVYNKYKEIEEKLINGQIQTNDSQEMIELIALSQPLDTYKNVYTGNSPVIKIFTDYKNSQGGSLLDDRVQKAFLGYRRPSRGDSIDTNRELINTKN